MDWELDRALLLNQRELDYLHTMQAINTHMHISAQQQQQQTMIVHFIQTVDAPETLTSTKHFRSSIMIFQSKEENSAIGPLNGRTVSLSASVHYKVQQQQSVFVHHH